MDGIRSRTKYIEPREHSLEESFIDDEVDHERDDETHDECLPDRVLAEYEDDNQEKKSDEHNWNITHSCKKSIEPCAVKLLEGSIDRGFECVEGGE
jgi:hypothetical protein